MVILMGECSLFPDSNVVDDSPINEREIVATNDNHGRVLVVWSDDNTIVTAAVIVVAITTVVVAIIVGMKLIPSFPLQ